MNYNLGQNKKEQLTPISPKAMVRAREEQKGPFWHHGIGGRGGPNVPFILSKIKIVVKDDVFQSVTQAYRTVGLREKIRVLPKGVELL